ncbi:multidrug effflux MFS transporter [Pediococcus acidilactici]
MKNVQKQVPSLMIIIALVGFPQISESIFTPVLPDLSANLNVADRTGQLVMSTYFIAFAVGVLFWCKRSDTKGRKPAMLEGLLVYLVGNVGLFFAPNFLAIIFFRLIQSFGASVGSVVTQTIMRESFSGSKGAKVFANVGAALALSPAIGPLLGGYAQTYFGYRSVFGVLIAIAVSLIIYTGARLPETNPAIGVKGPKISLIAVVRRLFTDRNVLAYGLLISGINGILFSFYAEAPFIFIDHFRFSPVQYGIIGIIIALSSIIGAIMVNRLVLIWSPTKIIKLGLIFSLLGGLFMFLTVLQDSVIGFITGTFIVFLGLYTVLSLPLNLALVGYEKIIGVASGIFSFAYYLVISFLTYLISVFHTGWVGILPIYIFIVVGIMTLVYWLRFNNQ